MASSLNGQSNVGTLKQINGLKHHHLISKCFYILILQLLSTASLAGVVSPIEKLAAKKTVRAIAAPLAPAISYLLDPESNLIQESVEDAMLFSGLTPTEAGACSTTKCQEFAERCRVVLRLPEKKSITEVLADKESEKCVTDFLSLPLDVQAELRTDEVVNEILSLYTPAVRDLKCSPRSAKVQISQNDKVLSFEMDFKKEKGRMKLDKISGQQADGEKDRVFFNSRSQAQQLQHCQSANQCKFFSADDVRNRKLYAWRDDRLKTSSATINKELLKRDAINTPIESFHWARSAIALADYQASRIYECCHPTEGRSQVSSCENFFNKRMQSFNKAAQKVRTPSAQ